MNILDKIMKPRSIAVVGASTKQHTIGSDIMKRLREYGYAGPVYPVNPKGGVIEGLPAYATVLDIPGEVDLAVIIVNARFVLQTIDQCHEKGIKGLCVISAGFKETGTEGARLEAELLERVRHYGMRCVGPNCLGVVNTHPAVRMDACFAEALPERGNIGPRTYAKVCELLLRLKANYLAPAMHPVSTSFNQIPENKLVADTFAIVMGSTHCEPLRTSSTGSATVPEAGVVTCAERAAKSVHTVPGTPLRV